jgi:nitroreductase
METTTQQGTQTVRDLKKARTQTKVMSVIQNRYSGRAFTPRNLTPTEQETLFEAASWAPSANNEQPWRYRFAENGSELFQQLFNCLSGGNQAWVKDAAGLILSLAQKKYTANGNTNAYAWYDVGAANAFLILQATELGFITHIMAGFDRVKAQAEFGDENLEVICMIAIGEQGQPELLEEPFRTRELTPRSRKSLDSILIA